MSKTQQKLFAAVETTMRIVHHAGVTSTALDVKEFRTVFKLTSMGKGAIVKAIDDILTTDDIVARFGPWVLGEIEHPLYQLSQLTANHVRFFQKEGDPIPSGVVESGLGTKVDNDGDTEDDAHNERALDQEAKERQAEKADPTREDEDEDPIEIERQAWEKALAGFSTELKNEFNVAELEILWSQNLIGEQATEPHSIEYLRAQVGPKGAIKPIKDKVIGSKSKKVKAAPKAKKAEPKKTKPAPKAKKAPKRK